MVAYGVSDLIVYEFAGLLLVIPLLLVVLYAFLGHPDLLPVRVDLGLLDAGEGLEGLLLDLEGVDLRGEADGVPRVVREKGLEFLHLALVGQGQLVDVDGAVPLLVLGLQRLGVQVPLLGCEGQEGGPVELGVAGGSRLLA